MNSRDKLPEIAGKIAPVFGLFWIIAVVLSYIHFNGTYYTYKISVFGSFIFRLLE